MRFDFLLHRILSPLMISLPLLLGAGQVYSQNSVSEPVKIQAYMGQPTHLTWFFVRIVLNDFLSQKKEAEQNMGRIERSLRSHLGGTSFLETKGALEKFMNEWWIFSVTESYSQNNYIGFGTRDIWELILSPKKFKEDELKIVHSILDGGLGETHNGAIESWIA